MPYTISKNNQGEFCVYKQDADGQPMGDPLGCHKTQDEAAAQIGAVERSESSKSLILFTQSDVNYAPVSPRISKGEACAACRWYCDEQCHLVKGYPATIEPTGVCDRFEVVPELPTPEPTPVVIVGEEMKDQSNNRAGESRILSTLDRGLSAIKSLFGIGSNNPGQSVFKALGNGLWFAAYTNNFKDLEGEILAQAAHDRYIARLDKGFTPMPELWHWHEPSTRHGKASHIWREGHVICAVGTFDQTSEGKAAERFYHHSKPGDIELSHGFQYPQWAKSADGIYEDYNTFEITTILSKYGRGANPYTSFQEIETMALDNKKKQSIIDLFGQDQAEKIFTASAQMEARAKALAQAGIAYKDFADVTETPKPTPQPEAIKAVLGDIIEGQAVVLKALDDAKVAYDAEIQALKEQKASLIAREKTLDEEIARMRALLDAKPRRVDEQSSNVVDDAAAKKAVEEAAVIEYDPHYPGMKIPKTNGATS